MTEEDRTDGHRPVPPVFVVGMPRSGTTLLARLLESCGPYAALPESHFFSRFIWESLTRRSLPGLRRGWRRFAASRPWPLQCDLSGTAPEPGPSGAAERYRTVFLEWVAREQARAGDAPGLAWVENTPVHLEGLPFIRCLFPEARVIGLVRDPRAVHASLAEVDWNRAPATVNAERWSWYLSRLEHWSRSAPDWLRLLRYEDLVRDPDTGLAGIGAWLGVHLETPGQQPARGRTGGFDPEREPWKARAVQPPDPARIGRWRERLDAAAVAAVERRAMAGMSRQGYTAEAENPGIATMSEGLQVLGLRLRLRAYAAATQLRLTLWRCPRTPPKTGAA